MQDTLAAESLRVAAQVAQQLKALGVEPLVLREQHVGAGGHFSNRSTTDDGPRDPNSILKDI